MRNTRANLRTPVEGKQPSLRKKGGLFWWWREHSFGDAIPSKLEGGEKGPDILAES